MTRISTFDDWIDCFKEWQRDIGYDADLLGTYKFETKLGDIHADDIEFGDYQGQSKWERVGQIPNQSIRGRPAHPHRLSGGHRVPPRSSSRRTCWTTPPPSTTGRR